MARASIHSLSPTRLTQRCYDRPDALQCNIDLAGEMHTTTCAAADNLQRAKRNIEGQHAVCKMQHLTFAVQQVLRPAVDQLEQLSAKALARINTVPPTCCIAL